MTNLNAILEWIRKNPKCNRKKLCKKFENDNRFAYQFVKYHPEYKDFVKYFIVEPDDAYWWARRIGNQEFMKHKINDSFNAYYWARNIGDHEYMKQIIKKNEKQKWIDAWNNEFEDDQI